mgnify:CR=1 FL=1
MNWTEAVRLAKEGKDQGYDFLYMQTYQKNYYVALRYMKQEDTAQDVLQDAYIKAFNNLEQLQDAEKFPGWMARIVTTTALDELKKRKIVLFSQIQNEDDEVGMEEILEDERTDTQPELAIDQKETKRLVQEMIDTLSEEQKMCIMMYYVEEMSVKEIAQTLNVSENTVKSRLNYGRKNIEAKALELEKKGTKLYGIAPFPFFLYLLHRDVLSVQVAEIPFGTILKQKAASAGEKAGKSILSKASVLTAKKAVIGTVMGLALCGSAAAVIYSAVHNSDKVNEAVNQVQEDVKETEPQEAEPQETEPQEAEPQKTEPQETEPKEAESESIKWQDAYLKFAASIQADDNGYAVLDVAGSDAPILVVMPDVFQMTSYILSDNSCIYKSCWPLEMYYYDLATDEVIRITDADSDSPNGALVEGYMDLGFYLTYLESEKLLVGDLVGSSAVIETYSVNQQTGHLNGEEAYVDEAVETVERKDIIYYRTVEQAIENIGAVQE